MVRHIAFLGFGEAGRAFAAGLTRPGLTLSAYDIKLEAQDAMAAAGVRPLALQDIGAADLILCLVTADQAVAAARAAAPFVPGALWLDGNSCSPGSKRLAGQAIAAAGGRYLDLAIMAPVHPRGHRTPLLLSGPEAATVAPDLTDLGMRVQVAGDAIGRASAIKMMRSVIIKGFEALTAEAFLAARAAGVEAEVLASLQASDPGIDWGKRGAYNLDRMLVHGARRAAEMEEVAATLRELGLPDRMARATIPWQTDLAALGLDPGPEDLTQRADMILAALR